MKDYTYIMRVLQGDKEQYQFLMDKYHNELFTYVYNIVRNYQTTEDLLQEIFMKVYQELNKYNPKKSQFRTWLYRVANNHTINYVRSKDYKTHLPHSEYDDERNYSSTDVERDIEKEEKIKEVIQAIKKVLKPKYQEIMMMHFFGDLSVKEISESFNMSDKSIYYAIDISIKKIKEEVNL